MDNIMNAVKSVYGNYAGFTGKASRGEFWWFVLFYVVVYAVLAALISVSNMFAIVLGIFALGTLIPYLAVGVRRLHDTGKSGWWILIAFIPLGILVLIFFWAQPSK
jgi:uncharacterized membrane protein YhaH (DUF805 family)